MKSAFFVNFKKMTHSVVHNISANRMRGRVIERFAKKINLIYFGAVSQRNDEHQVVRGFTVSSTHKDYHYCVGSIDGYDITIVDRNDASVGNDGLVSFNNWIIMTFSLHTKQDVPHIFINANNQNNSAYNSFFTTNPILNKIKLGTFEQYDLEFTSRFTIYASFANSIEVERLMPVSATRVLGTHFWPYSAELQDGNLYIYCDIKKIASSTLDTMLADGLWLAQRIDSQIELI